MWQNERMSYFLMLSLFPHKREREREETLLIWPLPSCCCLWGPCCRIDDKAAFDSVVKIPVAFKTRSLACNVFCTMWSDKDRDVNVIFSAADTKYHTAKSDAEIGFDGRIQPKTSAGPRMQTRAIQKPNRTLRLAMINPNLAPCFPIFTVCFDCL